MTAAFGETYEPKALEILGVRGGREEGRPRAHPRQGHSPGRAHQHRGRPITCEVGVLPAFTAAASSPAARPRCSTSQRWARPAARRSSATLAAGRIQALHAHYNFPPFSTGEVAPNTRAEAPRDRAQQPWPSAIEPMIPAQESFAYTLRLVSRPCPLTDRPPWRPCAGQHPRADGRRRADQGAGRGHRDGPGDRRRRERRKRLAAPS